jgi:hypothetical protein
MLDTVLEFTRLIDLKSFVGGLTVAGTIAKGWISYRKRRQSEAEGSHFTVKDGVGPYDGRSTIRYQLKGATLPRRACGGVRHREIFQILASSERKSASSTAMPR